VGIAADIVAGKDDIGSRGCPYRGVNCAAPLLGRLPSRKRVNRVIAASSAMAAATMPTAMSAAEPTTVSGEAGMSETMAKAAMAMVVMEPVVMVEVAAVKAAPAAVPTAIVKIERAVDWIGIRVIRSAIVRLPRASGEEKTDADQERRRLRYHSAALHRSLHSYEFIECPGIAIGDLHPVVDVRVVHCVALSVIEYASTGHRLLVGSDGACQVVHLPGWAFERSLKSASGQAESRRRIAAHGIKLAIGRSVEGFDI
jgi:hypothetical protein